MVKFYNDISYVGKLRIVLIVSRYKDKWVFCRRENTFECPGGHIEVNESHYEAACRELEEETGALKYSINFISFLSISHTKEFGEKEVLGALYAAEILEMMPLNSEIQEVCFFENEPNNLTYPITQDAIMKKIKGIG